MPRIWREHGSFTVSIPPSCTPYAIKPGVILTLNPTLTTTLTERIVATPTCLFDSFPTPTDGAEGDWEDFETLDLNSLRDPFYASTIPMAYSIAATTVLAYVLLLLLFLPNPPNARPWLQKVATMMVCICLTIAFAETTDVLSEEYNKVGSSVYSLANEARQVREQVVAGVVMKTGRVISDLFLWLAQVQTLIRLFPREREKAIIKWAGFALILLDTTFSVLQAFVSPLASTESFLDAIPALSYLFQLTLSMLYASCVIYYSIVKRRYAWFYRPLHPFQKMTEETGRLGARSIILVAVMGLVAVLTPIVFFIVDIAQKDLAGWGDYIRWVGAASASVVVWEWVDRIEGLEREERKDGVLGREVFEEDEEVRYYNHRDAGDDDTDRHDGGDRRGGVLGRGRRRRRERDISNTSPQHSTFSPPLTTITTPPPSAPNSAPTPPYSSSPSPHPPSSPPTSTPSPPPPHSPSSSSLSPSPPAPSPTLSPSASQWPPTTTNSPTPDSR
ncbi:PalH-domain-containing protein [Ascodesmis nigricans]|uniref:PalH-domain-containing protein n=1 Tax=Ascodesmis nigricans TaxID=341454 RepID=A0A4S2N0Y0_9PEZI|nr:PalH-domain-containing protein [Ascodesmis nigricans]